MARTIVDSHTHVIAHREPVWGWGPHFTIDQLIQMMDREIDVMGEVRRVDKAVVMTGLGLTTVDQRGMEEAHQYVLQNLKAYQGRLYLNAVINPRAWVPDDLDLLAGWKRDHDLVMLKLHPSMHNYYMPLYSPLLAETGRKLVYPVFEQARALDIPVMIHMGETPYAIPAHVAPVAEAFPDVPMIVAHSGANNIPSNAHDAILLARTYDNIYLGTSWMEAPELQQMYYAIGAGKIIFESDCSPRPIGTTIRITTNLHLAPPLGVGATKDEVYQMIGGTIAGLCHIPID
ncbi:amidohydrolase family protein [Chloroflexota bacterium]